MRESIESAVAANRYGLGARPGELAAVARQGPRRWLDAQLAGGPPLLDDPELRSTADILTDAFEIQRERRAARAALASEGGGAGSRNAGAREVGAVMKLGQLYRPLYVAEATARLREAIATDRPFIERLTHFWTNHFAVSVDKPIVLGLAGSFEREAIRPHVLGTFTELVLAVEQHPAMLLYLDNQASIGPDSPMALRVARRRPDARLGINENLGREIMELHTLGVGSGYTQADVTTFAKVISGWSIGRGAMERATGQDGRAGSAATDGSVRGGLGRMWGGESGRFVFRPGMHEPGPQVILGKRYDQEGIEQGIAVLTDFSLHPATARHIATKLARHFISDDPPPAAVERLAQAFSESGGDLKTVYRALIRSPEPWTQPLAKYKTPSDYVISTFRGLSARSGSEESGAAFGGGVDADGGVTRSMSRLARRADRGVDRAALAAVNLLGERPYCPGSPAGWPDRASDWDGASALLKRIRWADALAQRLGSLYDARALARELLGGTLGASTRTAIARAASASQALTLLLSAPEFLRR